MAQYQTSYTENIVKAYAGMVANGETSNRITRTNESATAIPFGAACYRGSGDHGVTPTVGTLATFYGWAIAQQTQGFLTGQTADAYIQYENVPIMTGGSIYIAIKGSIADGTQVTVGTGGGAADLYGGTAADATHIATGWYADETVTDGLCRIYKR